MYGQGVIPEYTPKQIELDSSLDINSIYQGQGPGVQPIQPGGSNAFDAAWNAGLQPSLEAKARSTKFDWEKNKTDRFINSDYYNTLGANPNLNNEFRYGAVQTWGNTMGNALGGAWKLGSQTFVEGWKGWGNMANALFNWTSEDSFSERLMGTPEELMAQHKEQEAIFNKYAIFSTPESESTIFNRQFLGNLVQQSGFALGAAAQFATETLLTAGAVSALKPFTAARIAAGIKGTTGAVDIATNAAKASKISRDIIKGEGIAEKIWEGTKKFVPMLNSTQDAIQAYRNGDGLLQAGMIGLGGVKRALSEFNMAATEARFEAAGTYGTLYGNLYDQFVDKNGRAPGGDELTKMQESAQAAATDNFYVNTGILMVANRIQFDNLLTKFSSGRSVLKNVTEQGTDDLFSITGKTAAGKTATEVFEKGRFGKLSSYSDIKKTFGAKRANWEAFKAIMVPLGKWEISEGVQELAQETSNEAYTQYYSDLYNGNKGDLGQAYEDAAAKQYSMQGLKTFLMGAVTGRLISPLSYVATKSMERIGSTGEQRQQKQEWVNEQKDVINAFYADPTKALNEAVANTKVGNSQAKTMADALKANSRFEYNNARENSLAKTVAAAKRTNMLPTLLDTIREYGDYFTQEEWKQAYGDLNKEDLTTYTNKVADEIQAFSDEWDRLNDQFGDLIIPASAPKNSEEFKILQQKKAGLDAAIEVLATASYKDKKSLARATELLTEVSAVPNIGNSSNQAFRVLSDNLATVVERDLLQKEIEGLQQITEASAADREYLKEKRAQLKILNKWIDRSNDRKTNESLKAFEEYINVTNKLSKNNTLVNKADVSEVFKKFTDYRKLYDRHRDMLNAFNTLVDPMNFKGWVMQLEQAHVEAVNNLKTEHVAEFEETVKEQVVDVKPVVDDAPPEVFVSEDEEREATEEELAAFSAQAQQTQPIVVKEPFEFDGQQLRPGQRLWRKDGQVDIVTGLNNKGALKVAPGKDRTITNLKNHSLLGPAIQFGGEVLNIGQEITGPDGRKFWITGLMDGLLKLVNVDNSNDIVHTSSLEGYSYTSEQLVETTPGMTYGTITEINNVYPHVEEGQTKDQADTAYQEFLANVDIEDFNKNAEIVVTLNDQYGKSPRASKDNPNLQHGKGQLTVQLRYKDKPIGYLTQPENNIILRNTNGTYQTLTTQQITQSDFNRIYKVEGVTPQQAYSDFMIRKAGTDAVTQQLLDKLGDQKELVLKGQELTELLNLQVIGGGFNWTNSVSAKTVILPIGTSGSGKSTWIKNLPKNQYVVISPDEMRVEFTGNINDKSKDAEIYEEVKVRTIAAINNGKQVVIDSTNLQKDRRRDFINTIISAVPGVNLQYKLMPLDAELAKQRIKTDIEAGIDRADVPDSTIDRHAELYKQALKDIKNEPISEFGNTVRTPLKKLKVHTAKVNGKRFTLIVDRFQPDGSRIPYESGKYQGFDDTPITDAEELTDIAALGELWNSVRNKADKLGRYVTVISLPNGTNKVIELSPAKQTVKQTKELISAIQQQIEKTKAENIGETGGPRRNEFNDEFNVMLNTQLFISPARGYLYMSVSPMGKVRVDYELYVGKKEPMYRVSVYEGDGFAGVKTQQDLVDFLNNVIAEYEQNPIEGSVLEASTIETITADNLKQGISHGAPNLRELEGMDVKVSEDIAAGNFKLGYHYVPQKEQQPSTKRNELPKKTVNDSDQPAKKKPVPKPVPKVEPGIASTPVEEKVSVEAAIAVQVIDRKARTNEIYQQLINSGMSSGKAAAEAAKQEELEYVQSIMDREIDNTVDINEAFKLDSPFDAISASQVAEFRTWAKQNLPDFITVESIEQLERNLLAMGVPVGKFITYMDRINNVITGGQISIAGRYGYHEAFHAVFRLMLNDNQIDRLLTLAKQEVRPTKQQLQEFKNSHPTRQKLDAKQLEELYLEEYLADKFQAWVENKKVQTSATAKGFFAKLWEWIKNLFSKNTPGELEALYSRIDQGGYKNSNIQGNRFQDVTTPAYMLINIGTIKVKDEDGKTVLTNKYLGAQQSSQIVNNIVLLHERRRRELQRDGQDYNKNQVLNWALDKYKALYDIDSSSNIAFFDSIVDVDQKLVTAKEMLELHNMYADDKTRQGIKEAVDQQLRIYGYKAELDDETVEDLSDDLGDRGIANQLADRESFGGIDSMSREAKRYIASLSIPDAQDIFGNQYFDEDTLEPLPQALNVNEVYTGVLKALKGTVDKLDMLDKLEQLATTEGQTGMFARAFMQDMGLTKDTDGNWSAPRDPNLVQLILNSFNNYQVVYAHELRSATGDLVMSNTDQQQMLRTQLNSWQDGYLNVYLTQRRQLTDQKDVTAYNNPVKTALRGLQGHLEKGRISAKQSQDIAEMLHKHLGISLTPEYIRYSVAAASEKPTKDQIKLLKTYGELYGMTAEDIGWISKSFQDNLFKTNTEDESGGALGRMRNIAAGNSLLDERVDTTSFIAADGNRKQSYQQGTFHLRMFERLKNLDFVRQLGKKPFLVNHPVIKQLLKGAKLEFIRAEGIRTAAGTEDETTGKWSESTGYAANKRPGKVYGEFNPQENQVFLIDQYAKYTADYHTPVLIRVLETSNTGDMAKMPVIHSVKREGKQIRLTNEALDLHFDIVNREFERIREALVAEAAQYPDGEYEGYHYAFDKDGQRIRGRAFKFFNAELMMGDLAKVYQDKLLENPDYQLSKQDIKDIKNQVEQYRLGQASKYITLLKDLQLIAYDSKEGYSNRKLGKFIEQGFKQGKEVDVDANTGLNMQPGDLEYNLYQIYISNYLNTTLINQVLRADEAIGLKNAVDAVKRAKGANGGGSTLTSAFANPKLGIPQRFTQLSGMIFNDPKFTKADGSLGDLADGQTYATPYAYRHVLYGLGKLTPQVARLLDKIDRGQKLTTREIFGSGGLVDNNGMFLPIKLAYYDGEKMVKTSIAMLPREITSYKDKDGNWVAYPNRIDLHNLLDTLEIQERKSGVPTFAGPQSAFKQARRNVLPSITREDGQLAATDKNFDSFPTDNWVLQVENPSNKLTITDPSQAKQIIIAGQDLKTKVMYNGKKVEVGKVFADYLQDGAQRVKNSYTQARNEIFDIKGLVDELDKSIKSGNITPKLADFQARAVETLESTGASSQTIEFFRTKDGKPLYDLNGPHTLNKYTQLFLAYFTSGVMREKIPGHALILMSGHGMKIIRRVKAGPNGKVRLNTQGLPMDFDVIPMSMIEQDPQAYQDAKRWDDPSDTGPRVWGDIQVGDLLIDDLRSDLDELDASGKPTGVKYDEMMMPPHFKELMGENPADHMGLSRGFAVRIPSQDKASFSNTRVVDFLPAYLGSTAVMSREAVDRSGADFDVDKIYIHIPESYVDADGIRTVYANNSFGEYINYQLQHNKQFKKLLKELRTDPYTGIDTDNYKGSSMSDLLEDWLYVEDDMYLYQTALKELGLPNSKQEFEKSGIINNGVLNNRILEQKQILFTNSYTVDNGAYTSVDIDPFKKLATEWAESYAGTEFGNRLAETPTEVNDMLGIYAAQKNNKAGAKGIGPIANALLTYSLLNSYKVQLREEQLIQTDKGLVKKPLWRFNLDDKTYKGYDRQEGTDGIRIASTISRMVTMEVDNAAERLQARFGLTIEALGMVANLVGQGVPYDKAVLFINQPIIQDYFEQTALNSGALTLSQDKAEGVMKAVEDDWITKYNESLDKDEKPNTGKYEKTQLTTELLDKGLREVDIPLQLKMLEEFKGLQTQTSYFTDLAQVVKIVKGLPSSFEDVYKMLDREEKLGLNLDDKEFKKSSIPFDLREILDKTNPMMANYRAIRDQIMSLSKSMFIEQNPAFQRIMDVIQANTFVRNADKSRFNEGLKKDLIAYLSIKAYKNYLASMGRGNRLATVDNSLIYNTGAPRTSIIDSLQHVREKLPGNYLAEYFLNPLGMDNPANNVKQDKLEANTWNKLSEIQTEKVLDSFMDIYQNQDTRQDAWTLFHYLLVKDGGLFKSNSFISFVPPVMFKDLLDSLTKGRELLAREGYDEQQYTEVFGETLPEVYHEFVNGFLQHFDSTLYLPMQHQTFLADTKVVEKPGIKEVTSEEAVGFPLYIRQQHKDFQFGFTSYTYHKLQSVDDKQLSTIKDVIAPGKTTVVGNTATYIPFEPLGARGSFRLSEMNGILPANKDLYKETKASYTGFEGLEDSFDKYNASDEDYFTTASSVFNEQLDRDAQAELFKYGIKADIVNEDGEVRWKFSGGIFTKSDEDFKKATGVSKTDVKTTAQLLAIINADSKPQVDPNDYILDDTDTGLEFDAYAPATEYNADEDDIWAAFIDAPATAGDIITESKEVNKEVEDVLKNDLDSCNKKKK